MRPESQIFLTHVPSQHNQAIKKPIYLSSTYEFADAEQGRQISATAYGLADASGYFYARMSHPNAEEFEQRLSILDASEAALAFETGMAAITTTLLCFLEAGSCILCSHESYSGAYSFITKQLPRFGITVLEFYPHHTQAQIEAIIKESGQEKNLKLIYFETPTNPNNSLVDLEMMANIAQKYGAISVVDNTYLGPCFQKPAQHHVDLSVYSATKYLGGHSDIVAGAVSGRAELIEKIRLLRHSLGNIANPFSSWLLCRSTETLHLRMERAAENAVKVAFFLNHHPAVSKVYFLGDIEPTHPTYAIFKKQCTAAGAMLAFDLKNEAQVPIFLDKLRLMKQAVSLGGTESLATQPYHTTHAGWSPEAKAEINITPAMVRISVGIEHSDDLIADLGQALSL